MWDYLILEGVKNRLDGCVPFSLLDAHNGGSRGLKPHGEQAN